MTNATLLPSIELDDSPKIGLTNLGATTFKADENDGADRWQYWCLGQGRYEEAKIEHPHRLQIGLSDLHFDDPAMVSDDNLSEKVRNDHLHQMQAINSYFTFHPSRERGVTKSIAFQEHTSQKSAIEKYSLLISAVVGATTAGILAAPSYSALPAAAALQFIGHSKREAIMGSPAGVYSALVSASHEQSLLNSYRAILSPVLEAVGYHATETYEDGIGGLVVDYLREESRICVALADEQLQFIYKNSGEFTAKTFDSPEQSMIAVLEFAQIEFV
jgi:hypothetical protein